MVYNLKSRVPENRGWVMTQSVFVSRPTELPHDFEHAYTPFEDFLKERKIQPRRLGKGDYSDEAPLEAVITLMKECVGAIVIGYPQYEISTEITKAGKKVEATHRIFPTPWNHIEAALAFQNDIPTLVMAHEGVVGGVFDPGVTGKYVLSMNLMDVEWHLSDEFQGVFEKWRCKLTL